MALNKKFVIKNVRKNDDIICPIANFGKKSHFEKEIIIHFELCICINIYIYISNEFYFLFTGQLFPEHGIYTDICYHRHSAISHGGGWRDLPPRTGEFEWLHRHTIHNKGLLDERKRARDKGRLSINKYIVEF